MLHDPFLRLSRIPLLCGIILVSLLATPATLQAQGQKPEEAIEAFLDTIRSMEFPVKDQTRHAKLVAQADAYLDLDAMGRKALADQWSQAAPEDQKAFLSLLWKLIENVAYPSSHKFMGNFEVLYPEVKPTGDHFEVHSVIARQEASLNATVVYSLYQKDGQWKVDDVILDDVSIIEDLKYQFDKLIAQSGFAGLLDKMRERLATAEKENNAPAA